jgi:hypothetical protein
MKGDFISRAIAAAAQTTHSLSNFIDQARTSDVTQDSDFRTEIASRKYAFLPPVAPVRQAHVRKVRESDPSQWVTQTFRVVKHRWHGFELCDLCRWVIKVSCNEARRDQRRNSGS